MPPDVLAVLFGPAAWGYFFLSPLIVYLLVSPLALWSDYPATRWLLGGWTALGLLAALLSFKGIHLPARLAGNVLGGDSALGMANAVMTGLHRGLVAADPPGMPDAWGAVALWLAIGAALTVFAARFRPDDLRRIARGLRA